MAKDWTFYLFNRDGSLRMTWAGSEISWDEMARMDVMETHVERLNDLFSGQPTPFVR